MGASAASARAARAASQPRLLQQHNVGQTSVNCRSTAVNPEPAPTWLASFLYQGSLHDSQLKPCEQIMWSNYDMEQWKGMHS